jgi:hypothetical protein
MASQIARYVQWKHALVNVQPNTAVELTGALGTSTFTRASEVWPYVVPARHFLALQRIQVMSKGGSTGRQSMLVLSAVGTALDNLSIINEPPDLIEPGRTINATIVNNEEFAQNIVGAVAGFLIETTRTFRDYGQILTDIGWHFR